MKNDALAKVLIDLAGGKDNLRSASHCMTRLRFKVKDDSLVKQEEIKKTEGVMGLVVKADEYQIVIGPGVGKVYDEVIRQTGLKAEAMVDDAQARKEDKKKKGGLLSMALDTVAGIFIPAIGLIAGGGALKGFLAVFVQLGLLASDSGTYTVLYALGDSVFYFFPIIIGYNSGKKFGGNPILTAGLGCALIYPTLITAVTEGTALTLFGIPLTLLNYTQSAFPIIFISYLAVKLEKLFKKILPDVTQVIFVPLFTLVIAGSLGVLRRSLSRTLQRWATVRSWHALAVLYSDRSERLWQQAFVPRIRSTDPWDLAPDLQESSAYPSRPFMVSTYRQRNRSSSDLAQVQSAVLYVRSSAENSTCRAAQESSYCRV